MKGHILKVVATAMLWMLCHVVQAGTVTYVYTDPQGTALAEADASGNITARFEYTPYGVSVSSVGAAPDGPGYTGHVNDPDTGFVYMQARYYDPATVRFLSSDPVAPNAGNLFNVNRYVYANGNPIANTDPDGRESAQLSLSSAQALAQDIKNFDAKQTGVALAAASMLPVVGDIPTIAMAVASPTAVNIVAAAVGVVPVVGSTAARAIKGASAAERVGVLAATMSKRTRGSVTLSVIETKEGTRLVASSEGTLRTATRSALAEGEVAAKGVAGTHAEVNGINAAKSMGLTPTGAAASRPICSSCAQYMERENVSPLSPLKE